MQSGSSAVGRRQFLKTTAAVGIAGPALAGCGGDGGNGNGNGNGGGNGGGNGNDGGNGNGNGGGGGAEVAVGPNGDFVFDPEEVTVSTGETVTWTFESASHNVECNPEQADEASLPDGADPFASYEGDDRFAVNDEGTTFEHTFDTAGEYTYICVPHVASDMIGTVVVE